MEYGEYKDKYIARCKERGHSLISDESGWVDIFAFEEGHVHNGPRCAKCGWGACWHCDGIEDIPECTA